MVKHHGIEATDIVASIKSAQKFVQDVGCPRPIIEMLCTIKRADLEAIEHASDNIGLDQALDHAKYVFTHTSQLFTRHAMLNTNGDSLNIMIDIDRWGGFDGVRPRGYTQLDAVIEDHLAKYPEPTEEQRVHLRNARPDPWIQKYGIACDLEGGNRLYAIALKEQIAEILDPFAAWKDFESVGISCFGTDCVDGVVFYTSPEGAKTVATALPHHKVISRTGAIIEPDTNLSFTPPPMPCEPTSPRLNSSP